MNGSAALPEGLAIGLDTLVHLRFEWRDHHFDAVVERALEHSCSLKVTADLGPMPYSAEGLQRRINLLAILRSTQSGCPVQIFVDSRQHLQFLAEESLQHPVTASTAIAGIARLLVQARPYLDMISLLQFDTRSVGLRQ